MDVTEMLEMDLAVEKKAVEIYSRAHKVCKHEPTKYMLEDHILDEDHDVRGIAKAAEKSRDCADRRQRRKESGVRPALKRSPERE